MSVELETMNLATAAWTEIDAAIVGYDKKQSARDWVLGRVLLEVELREIWRDAGFTSLVNYFEVRVGWDPHTTMERRRTALRLQTLPLTSQALKEGRIRWAAAREITRKATQETEAEWIEFAQGKSTHEVALRVRMAKHGDRPSDKPRPENFQIDLRLSCNAESYAILRRVIAHIRENMPNGHELGEAECLVVALSGGIENLVLEMTLCPNCQGAGIRANGDNVAVPKEAVEARADTAKVINPDGTTKRSRHVPKAVENVVKMRANHKCETPFCRFLHHLRLHHLKLFSEGGEHTSDVLMNLCDTHHRLFHDGKLLIEGSRRDGIVFKHPDGTLLGRLPRHDVAIAFQNAFRALMAAGLREGDVREALRVVRERGVAVVEEDIVTAASRILTKSEEQPETSVASERLAEYRVVPLVPRGTDAHAPAA